MSTTTDLSKFGARELAMAEELLEAQRRQRLPDDFYDDGVTVMMNTMSGNVFLTNSEYQVVMLTDSGQLESFYSTPYEGREGFFEELLDEYTDMHQEDQEWFRQLNEDYYNEVIPLQLEDGSWVREGEEYWVIDDDGDVVETVLDYNTDYDNLGFATEDEAKNYQ